MQAALLASAIVASSVAATILGCLLGGASTRNSETLMPAFGVTLVGGAVAIVMFCTEIGFLERASAIILLDGGGALAGYMYRRAHPERF
jgi:hypothetical protein